MYPGSRKKNNFTLVSTEIQANSVAPDDKIVN